MKTFPEMTFEERVAWARGHILVSLGEGKFQDAVWLVCQQFALHPKTVEPPKVHHYWRGPGRPGARCGAKGGVVHDELNHVSGPNACKRCLTLDARDRQRRRSASAKPRPVRSRPYSPRRSYVR